MAQRALWSGTVGFGLVQVPVRMYTAISEKGVKFNQLNSKTGNRVRQQRIDGGTGAEVAYEDIVKGYEMSKDTYLVVTPEELEALAPRMTKTIDIQKFVGVDEIDPMLYDKSYYLGPAEGVEKPYHLLTQAMEKAGRVALGKIVQRGGSKQKLMAIRAQDGVLVGSMLVFGDEVNRPPEIEPAELSDRELQMATALIESLTEEFDPNEFTDEYREEVLALIEAKAMGETYATPEPEPEVEQEDLMAALEASLAAPKTAVKPKVTRKKATKKVEVNG
jgi:DNA end-binding protein Ku